MPPEKRQNASEFSLWTRRVYGRPFDYEVSVPCGTIDEMLDEVYYKTTVDSRHADQACATTAVDLLQLDGNYYSVGGSRYWSFAEAEDLIVLPSQDGDGWNRDVFPARPKWVRLPSSKEPKAKFDHRGFPWNPALCFLASERGLPKGIR